MRNLGKDYDAFQRKVAICEGGEKFNCSGSDRSGANISKRKISMASKEIIYDSGLQIVQNFLEKPNSGIDL